MYLTPLFLLATGSVPNDKHAKQAAAEEPPYPPQRWEQAIADFETHDKLHPAPRRAILFVGSSSIRLWDTRKYFPNLAIINRGFGGSYASDSVYFADRIVIPYEPKTIVFYAGDNDIAHNKSLQTVLADLKAFVSKVHSKLPHTKIIYLSIKPTLARWQLWPTMQQANSLTRAYCQTDGRLVFVDATASMLDEDGKPRADLLQPDGLHLSEQGYKIWSAILEPYLH
jgi:lysophospholipase L1-like esterase